MSDVPEEKIAAARARMAELAGKFIDRSEGDLAVMRDALTRFAEGDADARNSLHQLSHRMTGTGATLGFEAVSDCAARLERLVEAQPPGAVPETFALAQITGALEALASQVANLRGRRS